MKKPHTNTSACPLGMSQCEIDTKLAALEEELHSLKKQVNTDPLTGLFNVRHLRYTLSQEMERTRRSNQATSFIILDVDHFKTFNDTYGHVVGDKVLIHLASIIKNTIRKIDIPCRYGGEEFAIILPSTPILIGAQVAERLRAKIAETPLIEDGESLSITISAGVDVYTQNQEENIENLIERADQQLYMAKANGRNRVRHQGEKITSKAEVTQTEKDALFQQLSDSNEE